MRRRRRLARIGGIMILAAAARLAIRTRMCQMDLPSALIQWRLARLDMSGLGRIRRMRGRTERRSMGGASKQPAKRLQLRRRPNPRRRELPADDTGGLHGV